MPEFEKGAPRISSDGVILGAPLMEIPEPQRRDTGLLTVEQLRTTELRLLKFVRAEAEESDRRLVEQLKILHEATTAGLAAARNQSERLGQESAERALDLTVRLHAVNQQAQERSLNIETKLDDWFSRQRVDLSRAETTLQLHMDNVAAGLSSRLRDIDSFHATRHEMMVDLILRFQQEVNDRTLGGRWRRLKAAVRAWWQGVRHGR